MGLVDQLDLKSLCETYLVANTPMYLYRHLRSNNSLRRIAEDFSAEGLVAEYESRTTKQRRSVEDIAVAYAMLSAITQLDYPVAMAALDNMDLSRLDWATELRDIYLATRRPVSYVGVTLQPRVLSKASRTETSVSTVHVSPTPNVGEGLVDGYDSA